MSELYGQQKMDLTYKPGAEGCGEDACPLELTPSEGAVAAEDARRLDVLAGEINLLERQARETFKRTAIEIGTRLLEARNLVPAGRWEEWLENNVAYSRRKAQQLMQVAEVYRNQELPPAYDKLSFTQIYDLLAAPAEARDALAEAAAEEGMSTRQLKAEIERLNGERQADQRKIYDLIQAEEGREREIKRQQGMIEDARQAAEGSAMAAAEARAELAKAADDMERTRRKARDAVQRANDTADNLRATEAALKAAEERVRALEAREPETVEVMPEGVAEELENLRRQLSEARDAQGTATDADRQREARVMAAAIGVRLSVRKADAELHEALKGLDQLAMLDAARAQTLRGDLKKLSAWLLEKAGGA